MVCFNKALFILRFACPALHGAVKPQAAPFKIKKGRAKTLALRTLGVASIFQVTSSRPVTPRLPSELITHPVVSAPPCARGVAAVGNFCLCWEAAGAGPKTFLHRSGLRRRWLIPGNTDGHFLLCVALLSFPALKECGITRASSARC